MADILSRIVGPVAIASGSSTLFTGTAGHTYSIKSIRVVNTDTVNSKTLLLGINGVAAGNQILPTVTIDAGGWTEWDGLITMNGTETLQATASGTGLTITVSGLDQS